MKIIITGPGGAGKSTLKNIFIAKGAKFGRMVTTRPKRFSSENEYIFIETNDKDLAGQINQRDLITEEFNGWIYGISLGTLERNDLFILPPAIINRLPKSIRDQSIVIYVNMSEAVRFSRLSKRNGDDPLRRIESDRADFANFKNFDLMIN
jgi:guanylate kinase